MAANQAHRDENLLTDIQSRLDSLNKSERKVAEAILRDPSAATRYSIAALARAANVSEPTVNRFCRGFSATGFPDFKIRLAQSIATGTPYVGQNVEANDTVSEFADKIMLSTIASLDKARQALDPKALASAIDYL
ncbi:MAG: transcriptional regulator HexR, partial [Marinobacter alexandrii]